MSNIYRLKNQTAGRFCLHYLFGIDVKQLPYRVDIDTIGSTLLDEYSKTILLPFSESVPVLSLPLQNTTCKNIETHWSSAIEHAHL
jgi:hypothetical protein